MHEINLILGDWSGDGHGKTYEESILCSVKNIDEYYTSFCKENPDLLIENGEQLLSYTLMTTNYHRSYRPSIERLIEFYNKNDFYKFAKYEENPCTSFETFEEFLGDTLDSIETYIDQYMFLVSYQYKKETGFDLVYEINLKKKKVIIGGYDLFPY